MKLLFLCTVYLYLDARAVLGLDIVDLVVGALVHPDQIKVVAGVVIGVVGAKLLGEIAESLVLPATNVLASMLLSIHFFILSNKRYKKNCSLPDENVALAVVVLDSFLDALGVVTVARDVDVEAEIRSQRLDSVERTLALAV